MNKEFEKPVLSIPLGSMVRINMEPLSAHNRNREFESGSYISDDPCLPSDYERINFLLVNYYNYVSFVPGKEKERHWFWHYYELLNDETLYKVGFRIGPLFHPDNFLYVVISGSKK